MRDRTPQHAGRVQLVPVAGQTNIYDMTMADGATEQGTPLNKATFLKDATAALFGLPNTAVPDDVFAWLGKYNTHCWRRRTAEFDAEEVKTDITSEVLIVNMENRPIQYSQSVSINAVTGEISLVNPQTVTLNGGSTYANQLKALAPCYIKNASEDPTAVYYMPANASSGTSSGSTIHYTSSYLRFGNTVTSSIRAKTVTADITATYGEWELLFSTNRSAYPDSGVVDGYEYEYLGVPFEKLPTAPQIEVGNYVGTGTYGKNNPTSLTFEFVPKLVFIYVDRITPYDGYMSDSAIWGQGVNLFRTASASSGDVTVTLIGSTLMWYCASAGGDARNQLNALGTVYHYLVIG